MRTLLLSAAILICHLSLRAAPIFSSGINEKFPHRKQLYGWVNTSRIIEVTLREWYGSVVPGPQMLNGSPADWKVFLRQVPAGKPQQLSILYLASHQTGAAEWEFKDKQQIRWSRLISESGRTAGPPSLVILDACFAASAEADPIWKNFAPRSLFASARSEAEYEIRFDRNRPYDAPRRYPAAKEWLRSRLGKSWNGRISFLGLMWVEAARETTSPPLTQADWNRFFERVSAKSVEFQQTQSKRLASTVRFVD